MFRVLSRARAAQAASELHRSQVDLPLAAEDDLCGAEFFSDNEEEEREYHSYKQPKSAAGSKRTKKKKRAPAARKGRRDDAEEGTGSELDELLHVFRKTNVSPRNKVLVPAADDGSAASSYQSGFSSEESSAAPSVKSMWSLKKVTKVWKNRRSGEAIKKKRSSGIPAVPTFTSYTERVQNKPRGLKGYRRGRRRENDVLSEAGESAFSKRSGRSNASSIFGLSFASGAIRNLLRRKKKLDRQESATERTAESTFSVPIEVGVVSKLRGRNHGIEGGSVSHARQLSSSNASIGGMVDARSISALQQLRSSTSVASGIEQAERVKSKAVKFSLGTKADVVPKKSTGISKKTSPRKPLEALSKSRQDDQKPLLASTTVVIDPMDIELFLKRPPKESEAKRSDSKFDDTSTISSLSSCSALTLNSMHSDFPGKDDYGVHSRCSSKKIPDRQNDPIPSVRLDKVVRRFPSPPRVSSGDRMVATTALTKSMMTAPPRTTLRETSAYAMPSNISPRHRAISILLIEPVLKIFEIVSVGFACGISVRDALGKACNAAADETLKKQTYVSLCSDTQVISNLDLSLSKLVPRSAPKTKKFLMDEDELRQEMERELFVAVPKISTATECKKIRRMLWKNPKLQAWWQTKHAIPAFNAPAS